MKRGFSLALAGNLIASLGLTLLPFITVIEEETSLPGDDLPTGIASLCLALIGLCAAAWFRQRRVQRAGWLLAGCGMTQLVLMVWTYQDIWALVPCADAGLSMCDPMTGALRRRTLVTLDQGFAVGAMGSLLALVGGGLILVAHPEYGPGARFLRLGLRWGDDLIRQQLFSLRRTIFVSEADFTASQRPSSVGKAHPLLTPIAGDSDRWSLLLRRDMTANCQIAGLRRSLHQGDQVQLTTNDSGHVRLASDLTLHFDFMTPEMTTIGGDDNPGRGWLTASLSAVVSVALVLLVSAFLHEPSRYVPDEEAVERHMSMILLTEHGYDWYDDPAESLEDEEGALVRAPATAEVRPPPFPVIPPLEGWRSFATRRLGLFGVVMDSEALRAALEEALKEAWTPPSPKPPARHRQLAEVSLDAYAGRWLGRCDRDDMLRVVRAQVPRFRTCYRRQWLDGERPKGTVIVRWHINRLGGVAAAGPLLDTLHSEALTACVLRGVRQMRFMKPSTGICIVQFPIVFGS